jgi:hypothetical protein
MFQFFRNMLQDDGGVRVELVPGPSGGGQRKIPALCRIQGAEAHRAGVGGWQGIWSVRTRSRSKGFLPGR